MGTGIGIAAFVLLLLSFPIPFLGNYITLLALAIATVAALAGEKIFTVTTTLLSGVKLFLLSPSWHIAMFGAGYMQAINERALNSPYADAVTRSLMQKSTDNTESANHTTLFLTLTCLAAPIAALIFRQFLATSTPAQTTNASKIFDEQY